MTWATKRKLTYMAIIFLVIALFAFIKLYPKFNVPPTCGDNKQNGAERGVDCGGACQKICPSDTVSLVVKWARSYPVSTGYYNSFAYIENQNITAAAQTISYEFSLFDDKNLFIVSRKGTIYVPPNSRFVVFEPAIPTGLRVPKNTLLRFTSTPVWLSVKDRFSEYRLLSSALSPTDLDSSPKLTATISNEGERRIEGIDIFAILYNADGNAIGASKTFLDSLSSDQKKDVYFTWRTPFNGEVKHVELMTQFNIFNQPK